MRSPVRVSSIDGLGDVGAHPLSALQQGMLFDSLSFEGSGRNIEVLVLNIHGQLDAPRLEYAWRQVTKRHDALRTSFRITPQGPVQSLRRSVAVPFSVEDVPLAGSAERDWYVRGCVEAERRRGFAPGDACWQRVRLVRFAPDEQALIWINHHAIMDGRSRRTVLRDIVDVYAGLTPLRVATSYLNHVAWLGEQTFAASEAFWRERLRGFAAPTPLPAAFQAQLEAAGPLPVETVERSLTGNDAVGLLDFARAAQLTPGLLVQAAWALLLARHAGIADVVFGTVRAGRHSTPCATDAVGLLIATPPLRVNVDESAPLISWLREVRARWDDLREHEHVPHRTIAAWSDLPSPQRLFETLVVYERETLMEAISKTVDPEGLLGVRSAQLFENTGFPLALVAAGTSELQLRLQYDPSRFGECDAKRLIGELCTILRNFPLHADGCVGDVTSLTDDESARLVTQWNRITPYPEHATAHELFHEHAVSIPDAVAVQLGDATMTYGELDRRSRNVAAHLQAHGIGCGHFVAVHLERSFEMVVALLGILKAGAASIALDMHYPPDRLATILREGAVRVIVSQAPLLDELRPILGEFTPAPPHVLDVARMSADPSADFHQPVVGAADAAHVMYTSGSTGVPKGAVLPHQAIVRTVRDTDYLRFASDETFFAFVPLTFDVAILEVWGPLLNGARLVLCPPGLPSLDVLCGTIEDQGVTTLWLTTALFEQVVDEELARLRGVRQLIVGGDVMSPAHARRLMAAFPGLRLVNVYGPTEATVLITAHQLETPPHAPIPLGRPIPNATVYILDSKRRPVPVGVPGEIFTGGAGLALGYLNRPELTAERFVPDPFSGQPGARMYRSGDLARWRDDGAIDFLGRVDNQVKIRGVRIELGAIESALTDHPLVQEAVVVATGGGASEKQLAAYVVTRGGAEVAAREIKSFLAQRLAAPSVPDVIAFIPVIPRTVTGKFDRRALPELSTLRKSEDVRVLRQADTPLEIAIAAEFAAVLELDDIGLDDDFYAYGGDSLRAMRLVARLRHTYRVALTVPDLIASPTVGTLSAALAALRCEPAHPQTQRLRAERASGDLAPIFFLHGDLIGGGRYCADIVRHLAPERPFFAWSPHGVEGEPFAESIEAMARENCAIIRERYPHGPVILGGYCNGGVVAFEMARQLERAGRSVIGLTIVDGFIFNTERSVVSDFMRRQARRHLQRLGLGRAIVPPSADAGSWQVRHDRLVESWYDALAHYVPRSYSGPTSLLWTAEIAPRSAALTQAWKRVAPQAIESGIIPGTHLTAVTRHLAETSEVLAASLEARRLAPPIVAS
jgi:amino acid adenylation domain-containing protein